MRIALYSHVRDVVPETRDVDWEWLERALATKRETTCTPCRGHDCTQKDGPLWSPVEVEDRRLDRNVTAVTALVVDVDSQWPADMGPVDRLDQQGVACIVHSTHAHDHPKGKWSVRLVFKVSRPIKSHEWQHFRAAALRALDLTHLEDPTGKVISRAYYLPSGPPDGLFFSLSVPGGAIDVDAMLGQPVVLTEPTPVRDVTPLVDPPGAPDVGELRRVLRKIRQPESKALVDRVLAGEAIAEEGNRDTTLNRACSILVMALPLSTPVEAHLHLLRPSLTAMPGTEGLDYWLAEAEDMLGRARARKREQEAAKESLVKALRVEARKVSLADRPLGVADLLGSDPGEPYSQAQLEAWGVPEKQWVIQSGRGYWVHCEGRYLSVITKDELQLSLPRDLARAPVKVYQEDANGNLRPRQMKDVLDECGTVARQVSASLVLQRSRYDAATQTFHEAVCPVRPLQPKEHPEVHEWLRLLGGDQSEKLLDWVATATRLDRQSCAVYLIGEKSAGKTMFAAGMARLWSEGGATSLGSAFGDFNSALTKCPLVFADEAVGKRADLSARLRELVGSTERTLNRKFLPSTTLLGAVRLVIAGNNERLLDTGEDLDSADLSAVASRFLTVHVDPKAVDYLKSLGGPRGTEGWVTGDKIAEHALWLAETREVKEGERFLVEGDIAQMRARLAIGSGVNSSVATWVCSALAEANPVKREVPQILWGEGKLWVSAGAMAGELEWDQRCPGQKVPTRTRVARALKALSVGEQMRVLVGGERVRYYSLDVDLLLQFAEENQWDSETLKARIDSGNERIRKHMGTMSKKALKGDEDDDGRGVVAAEPEEHGHVATSIPEVEGGGGGTPEGTGGHPRSS